MKNYIVSILIIVNLAMWGCKPKNAIKNDIAQIDTLLGKPINFPDNLLVLNGTKLKKLPLFKEKSHGKAKIISIVDGNCSKCLINQLNAIDNTFNKILYQNEQNILIFILNINKDDSAYFMHNLQPIIKAKGTILWDYNYSFECQNKLLTSDLNLRTFMVNKNDQIVMYGNPILHPEVIQKYENKLDDL